MSCLLKTHAREFAQSGRGRELWTVEVYYDIARELENSLSQYANPLQAATCSVLHPGRDTSRGDSRL